MFAARSVEREYLADDFDLPFLPALHPGPAEEPVYHRVAGGRVARHAVLPGQHRQDHVGGSIPQRPQAVLHRDEGAWHGRHDLRHGLHAQGPGKRSERSQELRQQACGYALRRIREGVQFHDDRRRGIQSHLRARQLPAGRHHRAVLRASRQAGRRCRHRGAILPGENPHADLGRRSHRRPAVVCVRAHCGGHRSHDRLQERDPQCADQRPVRSRQRGEPDRRQPLPGPGCRILVRCRRQCRIRIGGANGGATRCRPSI